MTGPLPVLPEAPADVMGLDAARLERLSALLADEVASGHRHAAEIAVARHGRLVLDRRFGSGAGPDDRQPPLWLLYSNTKIVVAAALWQLVEDGRLSFADPVARHIPGFGRHGKQALTVIELLTHQGGFPMSAVPSQAWNDPALLLETVCDFVPEWPSGSRVHYHPGSAWWVVAVLITRITGADYRDVVRDRVLRPLGLDRDILLGVGPDACDRTMPMREPSDDGFSVRALENDPAFLAAGTPGGGGFATARGMAAFYQMLAAGGVLAGRRVLSPRLVSLVTRDFTGERVDDFMGVAMHRGLGPHRRGDGPHAPGLGGLADPGTFGHGGVGSSFCWADPASGVSFAFLTDTRLDDADHLARVDRFSNLVHASILS